MSTGWSSEWLDLAEMDLGAAEYVRCLWKLFAITVNRLPKNF